MEKDKASLIRWIVDDITHPIYIQTLQDVALWHDKALLHFLLEESQQHMYFSKLKNVIKKGGYVIIVAFSLKGAKKCSGLNVKNYDQNLLSQFLGEEFTLLTYFDYTHHMPS